MNQLELEPEQVARLDEVSDPGLPPYPYGFIAEMSEDRAGLSALRQIGTTLA